MKILKLLHSIIINIFKITSNITLMSQYLVIFMLLIIYFYKDEFNKVFTTTVD